MEVSIILCTCNRAPFLRTVLDSVAQSEPPKAAEWEVLIVDNNSSDETPSMAREFARKYPGRFRYIFEQQPGKSYALNAGIAEARGDVLVFLDDDVKVDPGWLKNLTKPFEARECMGVGGRTLLADAFSPPKWLTLNGPYRQGYVFAGLFDIGDQPRRLDQPPYGVNMAYRREAFDKYGTFRTDLGPSPNSEIPRPNEDTEFGRRVLAGGEHLRYEPSAIVYHPLLPDRIRKGYFLNWWFDLGRARVRESGRRPDIWGIQRRFWTIPKIVLCRLSARLWNWMLSVDPAERFYNKCRVWEIAGEITEIYRRWGPVRDRKTSSDPTNSPCNVGS